MSDKYTDPRNISPRSDEFLSIIGPYIGAIEKRAHDAKFLVKGLSPRQRCAKLSWLRNYKGYFEVDYTRFDQTILDDILRIFEHRILTAPFGEEHHHFYHALAFALITRAVSQFGTSYIVSGTRCSGDAHTSIGNGILNFFLTWVCLRKIPRRYWRSIHEGDDGIIAVRGGYEKQVQFNLQFLACLGFLVKLKFTYDLESVTFCGRRFYETPTGLRDYCDVLRALKKFNTTMSPGKTDVLLYAKALSYNYTDSDTPLIGALSYAVAQTLHSRIQCLSKSRLKKAMAIAIRERWLLYDNVARLKVSRLFKPRPPDVRPEAYAAAVSQEDVTLCLVRSIEKEYLQWQDIGFIPNEITKIPVCWADEPRSVTHIGIISTHMI